MADTRNDPFPSFRFEVQLDDMPPAGFSECSGLSLEIAFEDYPEGGQNSYMLKFPGRTKQSNIVLKRGIVDRSLWDWFFDMTQGVVTFRGGTITVRDPSGSDEVIVWRFEDALPVKWSGPDLNATQNAVAVETLEICHHGLYRDT